MANGYVRVRAAEGWRYEHRVVMETMLGRALRSGEVVHHRNHDRTDNRPRNLLLIDKRRHDRMETRERWASGRFVISAPVCGKPRHDRHAHGAPCQIRGRCPHHG